MFSSSLILSSAFADESRWLDPYEFIGGQKVKVSHDSPDYPGSIIVDVIGNGESVPIQEAAILEESTNPNVAEIFQRFQVPQHYAVSSITICFRAFGETLPFALRLYSLGLPTDTAGTMTVEQDVLLGETETIEGPVEECTVVSFVEAIEPEDDELLLGILFDIGETSNTTAAIISAVGLDFESTYLEIDGCGVGIPDLEYNGQSLSEIVDKCAVDARNHGKFVSCVNKIANQLKKEHMISGKEKGKITSCAAKSSLP